MGILCLESNCWVVFITIISEEMGKVHKVV
jgi:hypothetical protein